MKEDDSNWFSKWEEELPSPDELMPLSQSLITPDLALAFKIRKPSEILPPPCHLASAAAQPNSSEFADSADLGSAAAGDEPARTLKRPRLVWTPQLHKRFVDAVAHLGIKNAVPKTIMQLMSVDGLTRENVASHLQKYRLYLKRMQGLSAAGGGGGVDSATDHLFASSPVPPHFLHGRQNSDHFLPFAPLTSLQHHHQIHRHSGHFRPTPNGHFEHPFLSRQTQPHRVGTPLHNSMAIRVEDLKSANETEEKKVIALFPTGDD